MPDLSYSDVRDILSLIESSTLDEIHVELGDFKLDARRHGAPVAQFAIAAPMLGMFYRAPTPESPPFIEVGKTVAPDDPLCIIEVLKLRNTIKTERPGRVAAILIENGAMVEFGQNMIVFDPL